MEKYDYIVVGGGSGGCVITHRLVNAGKKVLLLEDGPADNSQFIHMPATFIKVIGTERTVIYESEPQTAAANRKTFVPQGRTLGGGSSVNAMVYIRGTQADYEDWVKQGCTGWEWDKVLAAFKKAEGHMRLSAPYHGVDGPLKVSDTRYRHPLSLAFVKAAQESGIPYNDDFNGKNQAGIGFYHTTTFNGQRGSTASTYLEAVKHQPNLTIRTGCYVSRLIFNKEKHVTGLVYQQTNGTTVEVVLQAGGEIILAAGALSTPKILMLSGIGPGAHLQSLGIPIVHASENVGQNFQDHLEVSVYGRTKHPISLLGNDKGLTALKHGIQWKLFRTGLLTSNVVESGGFVDTTGGNRPDIQFHTLPTLVGDVDREPIEGHGISINPCHLRPASRGYMQLRSADPKAPIFFESGALQVQSDVETLKKGVSLARQILRAPSLSHLISEELRPAKQAEITDEALEAHVRTHAKTVYHPVGTCRMGSDEQSVVDTQLRVRGVHGLRICDASIMPTIVSGNTNAPVVMIAERCAEFILN
ncbi:GMC family oxidoreductase N-terminal domain-containing protein [Leeia sp. TBRC 13508]|uniref:GMC family oxidoreductase N-terminal domain-containing protein n=1 Tax=Leeia speluncae TaxID=2884804 RepID=A0ABS8DB66_9NEIS|nr:GMC family oxidoreductase N-terminal domain-containing protein [Leeia speluncae]MCB6185404.1 GMC family oxidoreductase N-terminal domain-containing protein [Leeia speluncae]